MILHQSTMRKLAPFLAAALLLCVAAVCADRHRKQLWGRSLGLKLLPFFIVLGIGRGFWEERTVLAEQKLAIEAESIYGVGEISEITDKESWVVLLLKNVQTEKGELRYLQVYAERNEFQNQTEYRIGDVVRVWGEFTQFQPASNPGEFDYAAYYRGQKLIWRVFALTVRRENPGERMDLVVMDKILRLRMWAADRLKLLAGEEDGSIFAAMILGDKAGMSEEIRDLYQKNGIAHLLAVSGVKTLKLDIPLVPETRINWAFVPLHIAIIYILKLCLDEEIIPRCRFPCSRGYLTKYINWQKKQ